MPVRSIFTYLRAETNIRHGFPAGSGSLRTGWRRNRGQNQSQQYARDVGSYMKVIRQGEDECMLTTISALSRVSLKEVKEIALTIAQRKTWAEIVIDHPLYWRVIKKLRKDVGLLKRKIPTGKGEFARGNRRRTLPKGKEGSICTEKIVGLSAHIDPFSNGKVWGTRGEMPMTLNEYKDQVFISGRKITGIWY